MQPGKFRTTWLGEECVRAGEGLVWNPPLTPLLRPVAPSALLRLFPVGVLAHCAPYLAPLRGTPRPRDSPSQLAWGEGLASSDCDIQGRSRPA